MKRNIRKPALLVIITVIATFTLAATVLADPSGRRSIQGRYAATGGGTCFVAPSGFDNLVPIDGVFELMTYTVEAFFTFKHDGTGHVERTTPTILNAGNEFPFSHPIATIAEDSWDFRYEVKPDGSITLTQVPGTYTGEFISGLLAGFTYQMEGRNRRGSVSPDGKTIILNGGSPDFVTQPGNEKWQMVCNDSAVLIWQHY
jgi:hypothetical protein